MTPTGDAGDELEQLALHAVEIAIDHVGARGERDRAGAVVAAVTAERQMHVHRHRILREPGEVLERLPVLRGPERCLPGGDGRVAGVAGPGHVVAGQAVGPDSNGGHGKTGRASHRYRLMGASSRVGKKLVGMG